MSEVKEDAIGEEIQFYQEDISFELDDEEKIITWIKHVVKVEGGELNFINFIFCSDAYLHKINLEYLQHDTYTDVITFPYSETSVESDIFISIERVRENAKTLQIEFSQELNRVIIHGVLHLLGYKDKTEEEVLVIREKEDLYIKRYSDWI